MENIDSVEALFRTLEAEGFRNKLMVYPAQVVAVDDGIPAPSATYNSCCLNRTAFANTQIDFLKLAVGYGFGKPSLPGPIGTSCTAMRTNELVVGSKENFISVGLRLAIHRK